MTDTTALIQIGGIVFAAGILWERLNALNKKVGELNGKTAKALTSIAELRVGQADTTVHLKDMRYDLGKHIEWANTEKDKMDKRILAREAS